jgi:ABC-2 type transport system permease protein
MMSYSPRNTLPFSVEFVRQLRRRRTAVAFGLMILLPLLVVSAVKFGPSSEGSSSGDESFGGGTVNLIGLATSGAGNFTVVMIFFATGFLLTTVFALFAGDTVASEASWSSLRYLLAAPVPRRRLLKIKLFVAMTLSFIALVILMATSYAIGWLAFGGDPLVSPLGGSFDGWDEFTRLALIGGYVFLTLLFTAGLAFYMSVRTDVPLGAVGTAVLLAIVLVILDAITALGDLRNWLPGHYSQAWTDVLNQEIVWDNMAKGASLATVLFASLTGLAFLKFDRKDIMS